MARRRSRRRSTRRIVVRRVNPNPPRRRRRRARRVNPHPPRRRRIMRARRNPPAVRRRRYRRNPMGGKWLGVALAAAGITVAEGLLRAYTTGMVRNWAPVALKGLGAWYFSRKESTRPIAYALGALAIADVAAMLTGWLLPASTSGWVTLPPGLAGPTGFPSGVGFPWAGIPQRIEQNPRAQAFAFGQAAESYVNPLGGVM